MSINVINNLKDSENKEIFEQKVHMIPCKIEEDGEAQVNKYFEPYITENENGDLYATFRGHNLDGTKMTMPEGYCGILVTESKRPLSEDTDRKFTVTGGFKEFVYWNWDKKPSKNDNMIKALDWVDIAEAIITRYNDDSSPISSDCPFRHSLRVVQFLQQCTILVFNKTFHLMSYVPDNSIPLLYMAIKA